MWPLQSGQLGMGRLLTTGGGGGGSGILGAYEDSWWDLASSTADQGTRASTLSSNVSFQGGTFTGAVSDYTGSARYLNNGYYTFVNPNSDAYLPSTIASGVPYPGMTFGCFLTGTTIDQSIQLLGYQDSGAGPYSYFALYSSASNLIDFYVYSPTGTQLAVARIGNIVTSAWNFVCFKYRPDSIGTGHHIATYSRSTSVGFPVDIGYIVGGAGTWSWTYPSGLNANFAIGSRARLNVNTTAVDSRNMYMAKAFHINRWISDSHLQWLWNDGAGRTHAAWAAYLEVIGIN